MDGVGRRGKNEGRQAANIMSSVRILCTKGHAEREIVKQVAKPRGNCVGGLVLFGGVAEAHSHMRAREDDACSRFLPMAMG
jgi:hypothetical protein